MVKILDNKPIMKNDPYVLDKHFCSHVRPFAHERKLSEMVCLSIQVMKVEILSNFAALRWNDACSVFDASVECCRAYFLRLRALSGIVCAKALHWCPYVRLLVEQRNNRFLLGKVAIISRKINLYPYIYEFGGYINIWEAAKVDTSCVEGWRRNVGVTIPG